MSPHGFRATSGSLVLALMLTVAGQASTATGAQSATGDLEPHPEFNPIAAQFTTTYGADEGLPATDEIDAAGNVTIVDSPADVAISLDASEGATIIDEEGSVFIVAPVVEDTGEVGLAGDHVVVFDTDPTDEIDVDLATRATSDGGIESTQYVPAGVSEVLWTVTSDEAGAQLVALENGTVALVDPDGVVDEEIASAAADLNMAEEAFMEASIENLSAAVVVEELAEASVEVVDAVLALEDPIASQEVEEVPSLDEISDESGQIPVYLEDNPDVATLEAEVSALMEGIDTADLSAEDLQILDFASAALDTAESTEEEVFLAGEAAVEAAMIAESDEMLAEDLDQILLDTVEAEMSAELDIADAEAEIERAATAVVAAQAQVGDEGRVLGVFAAPMSKTITGAPVATTLEVIDQATVAVKLPDLEVPVVVDPFFIPAVVFVVRTVAQAAVKHAITAAAQHAARQAAIRSAAQVAARVAARKAAEIARQSAARVAARAYAEQQRIAALRAQAQVAARVAAQKAQQQKAATVAREVAKAQKAKDLAAKSAKESRDKLAKLKTALAAQAARAKAAAIKAAHQAVQRAAELAKPVVEAVIRGVQVGTRTVQQAAAAVSRAVSQTVSMAKSPAGQEFMKRHLRGLINDIGRERAQDRAVEWFVDNNGTEADDEFADCYSAALDLAPIPVRQEDGDIEVGVRLPDIRTRSGLVASIFATSDVIGCIDAVQDALTGTEGNTEAGGDPDDHGGSLPSTELLGGAARSAYLAAQVDATERSVVFDVAPDGTPVGGEILEVIAPEQLRAASRGHVMIVAQNAGPALPLETTVISAGTAVPWLVSGSMPGSKSLLTLVDENGDDVWSHGESVAALIELDIPLVASQVLTVPFTVTTGGTAVPGTDGELSLSVEGPEMPGAPSLTATSGKSGVVPMSWTTPASDPDAPTTAYELQRIDTATTRKVTTTAYSWASLTNGTSYSFKVRACSAVGCSPWSATKTAKPYTVPSTVAKPSIASHHNALKIDWPAPSTGGSAITRYEVSGGASASTTSRSWTHKTGQSGAARQYRVRACNAAGCGAWSSYTNSLRPKVIALARGASAPYGYHYDTRVYGPSGWVVTLECHGPTAGAWWTRKVTLDSTGYYRNATLCYSGYPGGHWVMAGTLKSNTVSW